MSVDSKILLEIDFLVITTSYHSNLDFPGHILKISQNRSPAFKLDSLNKKTGPLNAGQEIFLPEIGNSWKSGFICIHTPVLSVIISLIIMHIDRTQEKIYQKY